MPVNKLSPIVLNWVTVCVSVRVCVRKYECVSESIIKREKERVNFRIGVK